MNVFLEDLLADSAETEILEVSDDLPDRAQIHFIVTHAVQAILDGTHNSSYCSFIKYGKSCSLRVTLLV